MTRPASCTRKNQRTYLMSHRKSPVPAAFSQTICATLLFFLAVQVARPDTHEAGANTEPVFAETGADGVQRMEIVLDSYSFTPAYIIVKTGKPVEFHLRNVATIAPHNFTLETIANGLDLHKDVAPGETAMLTFSPTVPGTYEFYCDKKLAFFPSHKEKGMIGKLEVR